jgi:hypothetical protein
MTAVEELVGTRLAPITLEAMNAKAALQVRVDSKYVLDLDRLDYSPRCAISSLWVSTRSTASLTVSQAHHRRR